MTVKSRQAGLLAAAALLVAASGCGGSRAVVPDSYDVASESPTVLRLSIPVDGGAEIEFVRLISEEAAAVTVEARTTLPRGSNPGVISVLVRTVELSDPLGGRRVLDVSGAEVPRKTR